MAHSADTDKYDDFGLSPFSQKAFSKSSLPRLPKPTEQTEDIRSKVNFGWLIRLGVGLVILGAGIFAVIKISENRTNTTVGQKGTTNNKRIVQAPAATTTDTSFVAASQPNSAPRVADTVAWEALKSSPADIEAQPTQTAQPPAKEPPVKKETIRVENSEVSSALGIKYYAIVGSFSDLEHAVESKQKLKIRTRVIEKDGKYRLVADSVISAKSTQYLIDSLKKKKPNWWLAKAQ